MVRTDHVQQWPHPVNSAHVRLEPECLVGDCLATPRQLEPAIDFLGEQGFAESLRQVVTRRSRDVKSLFDLAAVQWLLAECFEDWAVANDVAEPVLVDAGTGCVYTLVEVFLVSRVLQDGLQNRRCGRLEHVVG